MASASEHATNVLSAILGNRPRRDLLEKALHQLSPAHFPDKIQETFFRFLERYHDMTGDVLPYKFLDDITRDRLDATQQALYSETYQLYVETNVTDSDFSWSVSMLRELAAEKATGDVINDAMEILRTGKQGAAPGEILKGHNDARLHLVESFAAIDRDLTMQDAPEGDMKAEATEMLSDYAERKRKREQGIASGINFGIAALDAVVGGLQDGELTMVAGYSSDGKTSLCSQLAWSAAVEQGKNVLFLTTETLRPQVRRKLIARHSKLPIFRLPDGLNTRDLKAGSLSEQDEAMLDTVIQDLSKNPLYGSIYIAQVPRGATLASIEQRMNRIQRSHMDIDLVILDSLNLVRADTRRQSMREELAETMKIGKQIATTFKDGHGVPFVSPWQITREARNKAQESGLYSSASLSETAEATNSADVIVSIMSDQDNHDRIREAQMQVLKARDGETANGIVVTIDYATSWFGSRGDFAPAAGAKSGPDFKSLFD